MNFLQNPQEYRVLYICMLRIAHKNVGYDKYQMWWYPYPRQGYFCFSELSEVSVICMQIIQNSGTCMNLYANRTELGYLYELLTEPTEVSATNCMDAVHNWWKYRVRYTMWYAYLYPGISTRVYPYPGYFYKGIPVPRVFLHRCTERTEVPGTGREEVVQNGRKCQVRVLTKYYPCSTRLSRGRKKKNNNLISIQRISYTAINIRLPCFGGHRRWRAELFVLLVLRA